MDIRNLIPFGKKNVAVKHEEEHPFAAMQREMNRIFDSFANTWGSGPFPETYGSFSPRLDVTENAESFVVAAELPGMNDKDIDLSLSGGMLTISGEKTEDREEKDRDYHYSERSYGAFSRSIPLPREIDADKISATFRKGVLTVTLPKSAAAIEKAKKITVRTG